MWQDLTRSGKIWQGSTSYNIWQDPEIFGQILTIFSKIWQDRGKFIKNLEYIWQDLARIEKVARFDKIRHAAARSCHLPNVAISSYQLLFRQVERSESFT